MDLWRVTVQVRVSTHWAMETCSEPEVKSHNLNIWTIQGWVLSFFFLAILLSKTQPLISIFWKLGGPCTPSGYGGEDRSLVLLGIYWFVGYGLIWDTSPTMECYLPDLCISLPGIKLIICGTATLWLSYLASWQHTNYQIRGLSRK